MTADCLDCKAQQRVCYLFVIRRLGPAAYAPLRHRRASVGGLALCRQTRLQPLSGQREAESSLQEKFLQRSPTGKHFSAFLGAYLRAA